MVQKSIFVNCTRSDARQFLKKFIDQTNGKINNENSRRILWTIKIPKKSIKCNTLIVAHGKVTEITTSNKSLDILNPKVKKTITELYNQLHQEFEPISPNEVVEKPSSKKRIKTKPIIKSNTPTFNRWNVIAIIGFIIFGLIFIELYPSAQVKNSSWDNSVPQVERYLKRTLPYPNSFNPIMWSKVYDMDHNDYGYRYKVRVKYNTKNSFGIMETQSQLFYLSEDGTIINVE